MEEGSGAKGMVYEALLLSLLPRMVYKAWYGCVPANWPLRPCESPPVALLESCQLVRGLSKSGDAWTCSRPSSISRLRRCWMYLSLLKLVAIMMGTLLSLPGSTCALPAAPSPSSVSRQHSISDSGLGVQRSRIRVLQSSRIRVLQSLQHKALELAPQEN